MIDCHTHILPSMDDGSTDIEMSLKMLQKLKEQGVSTVWLTPHFYPFRQTLEEFLEERSGSFAVLQPVAEEMGMQVLLASETYLTKYLFNYPDLSELCVNRGRYMLTELPFQTSFSSETINRLNHLISTYRIIPILAHIERYPLLLKKRSILEELIELGCMAQINLSSLSDGFLTRRKLLEYLSSGLVQIVGTDCHNLTSRSPDYAKGMSIIRQKLGDEVVSAIAEQACLFAQR